jgi:hypothetical protein
VLNIGELNIESFEVSWEDCMFDNKTSKHVACAHKDVNVTGNKKFTTCF